ncbi:MAG: hypothetical protein AAB281_01875, partial [Actinomycetota bacterium]
MSIDQVAASLQFALKAAGASFSLQGTSDFASGLQLGQILKGKVLRHFEGSRYLVGFEGQEKVVDSTVPLRTDEIIYGRVIALGERVELQRVHTEKPDAALAGKGDSSARHPEPAPSGKQAQLIARLFDRYGGKLSADESATLSRLVKGAAEPESMVMAGLVLSKIGLTQSPDLLKAVYDVLVLRNTRQGLFALPESAPQLTTNPAAVNENRKLAEQLAPVIASLLNEVWHKEREPAAMPNPGAAVSFTEQERNLN